jgi:glycosyltransferase involved in cell wall biosynthesis
VFLAVRYGIFAEPLTFSMRAYFKLRELLSHTKFDVIHDNQCLGYGLLLMKHFKIPLVSTIHHPIYIDRQIELDHVKGRKDRRRIQKWYSFINMQHRVARRMDRIITVSQNSAEDIRRFCKVPQSKLRVVYNGVDGSLFKMDNSVSKEPNSLIMVGETRMKGILFLLRALQVLNHETEAKLTVVGGGSLNGYASSLVKEYGLEGRVDFTGRLSAEELVKRYSAAEVAIVPSLYEGFGFPAAEAMSCKVPLIATRAGALPEVAGEDGEAGILVSPADPDGLAEAIRHLLSDELLRGKMGEAGRTRVEEKFTWEQAVRQTVDVYRELM